MAGRRIRWANAGRVAAIAAAVLAGLATLPALLGSDEPAPLPEDVGIAGVAPSPATPAAQPPPVARPASVPAPQAKKFRGRPAQRDRTGRAPGRRGTGDRRRRGPRRGESDATAPAAPVPPVPTYVPAPAPPPPPREFRIEG